MTTIGDNIRKYRCRARLTQYDLGARCGMADSRIGSYERNEHAPRLESTERIANALGIAVEKLLDTTSQKGDRK